MASLFFFQAEDGIRDVAVTGVQTCALPILDLQVSFLPIEGKADMGGGLIWRAADDRNYYLTRANPLEQNIRIYRVVKGIRHLLQTFAQTINMNKCKTLHVATLASKIKGFYVRKPAFVLSIQPFTT